MTRSGAVGVRVRRALLAVLGAGLAMAAMASSASAATLTVTSTADTGAGSLREAVAAASAGDVITFSRDVAGTITLATGSIMISQSVSIEGPGAGVLTLAGGGGSNQRIFHISSSGGVDVSLSGLRLTGGKSDFSWSGGGAIYSNQGTGETLSLSDMTLEGNVAGAFSSGGAIMLEGGASLVIDKSVFARNSSAGGGGAILSLSNAPFSITDSVFRSNAANGDGGAIGVSSGAVPTGQATIRGTTFDRNTAGNAGWGGALALGSGSPTLRVSDSVFTGNTAPVNYGGAISHSSSSSLAIADTEFVGNMGNDGGAIYSDSAAAFTVLDSVFDGNRGQYGSALTREVSGYTTTDSISGTVFRGNVTVDQPGVIRYAGGAGLGLTMADSAVVGNTGGAGKGSAGLYWNAGDAVITNSTFANNTGSASAGSTLYFESGSNTLESVTVTGNVNSGTDQGGTGGIAQHGTSLTVRNSIVAGNQGDSALRNDCDGEITFAGANGSSILGAGNAPSCVAGAGSSPTQGDPMVGPLRTSTRVDGPGTTPIIPLEQGSPALDAADLATSPATDQRGVRRPQGAAPDIGAVEMRPGSLNVTLAASPERVALGAATELTAVATNTGDFPLAGSALAFGIPPAFLTPVPGTTGPGCVPVADGVTCGIGSLPGEGRTTVSLSASAIAPGTTSATATLSSPGASSASASVPLTIVGAGGGGGAAPTTSTARPVGGVCGRALVRVRTTPRSGRTVRVARVSCRLRLNQVGAYAFRFSKGKGEGNWTIARGSTVLGTTTTRARSVLRVDNVRRGRKMFLSALLPVEARSVPLTVRYRSASGVVIQQTIK